MKTIFEKIFLLGILISSKSCEEYDGCEPGWFRYDNSKCVFIYDFESPYDESEIYCKINFGANLLGIGDETERRFWTFHLMRYSNLSHNVWLQKENQNTQCKVLSSKFSKEISEVGKITEQDCASSGTTVCEIITNKPLKSKWRAREYNPNEYMIPNKRLKFTNGSISEIFTGVYYLITSKYNKTVFSNARFANGKCLQRNVGSSFNKYYSDQNIKSKNDNYFIFSSDDDVHFQIRRYNSETILITNQQDTLINYNCGYKTLTDHKLNCIRHFQEKNLDDSWTIENFDNSGYIIRTSKDKYTLGLKQFGDGKIVFGLYDEVPAKPGWIDDKLLFNIEEISYKFLVQLYSLEFDKSLEHIMEDNKQQISIVETIKIVNNSPAKLTHEVHTSKEFTESYSTSYGYSQKFMESISRLSEISNSKSNTDSNSESFNERTAQVVSSSLSNSLGVGRSSSFEKTIGGHIGVNGGARAGINKNNITAEIQGGINVGVHGNLGWLDGSEDSEKTEKQHSHDNEKSFGSIHNTQKGETMTHSNNTSSGKLDEYTKIKERRSDTGGQSTRTYSISKTVELPAYSSVRITSYANWVDDIQIPVNITLKFNVMSFRRQIDGSVSNFWRTMDSEFVKFIIKKYEFNGNFENELYDTIFGVISSQLRASVGLDSVFMAKEEKIKRNKN